jgi:NAD(P)-dependent dehydrogenase (short-subunit alcohol dehydrogenase family)
MRDVLVTGASGGIGSAVAKVLASAGQQVIALGRDSARLDRLSSEGLRVITADLADVVELRAAVTEIDHLDALIHCAGVSAVASVADTDPARCIQPDSLAEMIAWVLAAPPDSYVTELAARFIRHRAIGTSRAEPRRRGTRMMLRLGALSSCMI